MSPEESDRAGVPTSQKESPPTSAVAPLKKSLQFDVDTPLQKSVHSTRVTPRVTDLRAGWIDIPSLAEAEWTTVLIHRRAARGTHRPLAKAGRPTHTPVGCMQYMPSCSLGAEVDGRKPTHRLKALCNLCLGSQVALRSAHGLNRRRNNIVRMSSLLQGSVAEKPRVLGDRQVCHG